MNMKIKGINMTTALEIKKKIQSLIKLYETCIEHNDTKNGEKIKELIFKMYDEKLYISFAGHFSAGKSTMINTLLNEQILPTSPIPTSANIVMLEKGNEEVKLCTAAGEWFHLEGGYNIAQIKEFCTQGEDITKIHITKKYEHLDEHMIIIDTPGIDSTEAAHRLATESMLHLADIIFYVTDYNHVQSEENMSFIQEMKKRDKNICLVVNQIDKHREKEVPFIILKKQINESFFALGLKESDIFYTTLTEKNNKNNELEALKAFIRTIAEKREKLLIQNIAHSQKEIIEDHLQQYKDQLHLADFHEDLAALSKLHHEKESILRQIEGEKQKQKEIETNIGEKLTSILKNANLTPFETREKVSQFIEANEAQFKVGFLFSKRKTEEERLKRAESLYESLQKNMETELAWHITVLLKDVLKEYELYQLNDEVQGYTFTFPPELLIDILKRGASFNNQYILTYSADISNELKRLVKQQVNVIIAKITSELKKRRDHIMVGLDEDVQKLEVELRHYEAEMEQWKLYKYYEKTIQQIADYVYNEHINMEEWIAGHSEKDQKIYQIKSELDHAEHVIHYRNREEKFNNEIVENGRTEQFLSVVKEIAHTFEKINGFKQFSELFIRKISRYENRSFTAALFGAFSAGKSSFANALLGENLLPSSPTPTTATINKISPVTAEKKHGAVEVKLKDGVIIEENIQTFSEYVSNEEKARNVEEVVIYYDCPITRLGITLVDTPGADSFNTRHTDIAFQYIKNADAIIYVTYFNHPFTKGDREFLRQLGRVKDSFSLDKMFFIVNAIDLAKDKEEILLVKDYIREQLFQQEIRNSQLYGISSLNILQGNDLFEEEFVLFKKHFFHFIENQLMNATIISMKDELSKADEQVELMIQNAKKNETEKEKECRQLNEQKVNIEGEIQNITNSGAVTELKQEIKELLFYVKQRLDFRFSDFFKEAFHPGAIQNGKRIDDVLRACLADLVKMVEFEIIQELQATTLRLEKYIEGRLDSEFIRINSLLNQHTSIIRLVEMEIGSISTPELHVQLGKENDLYISESLKLFKNAKSFFEKDGKKQMSEDLRQRINTLIAQVMEHYEKNFDEYYCHILKEYHDDYIAFIKEQIKDTFKAVFDSFISEQNIDYLQKIRKEIQSAIELI
ncbi:dynamin family protein [Metabacillus fastidiosus]|uniref:dynamin family protein n=1 Tax=Metabacillus fastidiosus TaxID=1458 RepID=UPI003D2A7497